ncbi:DUF2530 domain-containing protein [Leekyejoonella antrihumi]|uniref:DUF2530 domain-containing protein n=1 Tax=Leekyejoonella antrihumi TaxID=1660198 RepID=A0A563DTG6_9MICO|nr:DUF2530 domain-containing protein [Leekyejoonella antrihumi]
MDEWHDPVRPQPVKVDVNHLILTGTLLWVVALVVLLAVPSLHQDGRGWWPWVPVFGVVLGVVAWLYVRRGRGNATAA